MKNRMLLLTLFSMYLCGMGDMQEGAVPPKDKLQIVLSDQKVTTSQYAQILTESPRLQELDISGHIIDQIPDSISAPCLVKLNASNGPLKNKNTLYLLLTNCQNLQECFVANNNLITLGEKNLPIHSKLTKLDCQNNKITNLDLTELCRKIPSLTELNMTNCPLVTCNTNEMKSDRAIAPTIYLRGTKLSDETKKEILKNAHQTCVVRDGESIDGWIFGAVSTGITFGSGFPILFSIVPTKLTVGAIIPIGIMGTGMGSLALGFGTTYLGFLCFKAPKDRFKIMYIPVMDKPENDYPEEEITTRYFRFVKYFPYLCNITNCCKGKDPESECLLEQVQEKQ